MNHSASQKVEASCSFQTVSFMKENEQANENLHENFFEINKILQILITFIHVRSTGTT